MELADLRDQQAAQSWPCGAPTGDRLSLGKGAVSSVGGRDALEFSSRAGEKR